MISIVYWSQTGNTQAMAEAISEGVTEAGKEAKIIDVTDASLDALKTEKVFALGCPAMGAEVLEESEMEPFVSELEGSVGGKTIALFGSYGWGDGQWMRDWCKRCDDAGANLFDEDGLTVNESPDDSAQEVCRELGRSLAKW